MFRVWGFGLRVEVSEFIFSGLGFGGTDRGDVLSIRREIDQRVHLRSEVKPQSGKMCLITHLNPSTNGQSRPSAPSNAFLGGRVVRHRKGLGASRAWSLGGGGMYLCRWNASL